VSLDMLVLSKFSSVEVLEFVEFVSMVVSERTVPVNGSCGS